MKHLTIILTILSLATILWTVQHLGLKRERHALELTRERHQALQDQVGDAQRLAADGEHQLTGLELDRDSAQAKMATAERQLAQEDPERFWVEPPAAWPLWETNSPYIWLPKDILGKFRTPVFTSSGMPRLEGLSVLAVEPEKLQALRTELPEIMQRYRDMEMENLEVLDEPLQGIIVDGPHLTVVVRPFPEDARRLRQEFESTLARHLGKQRADILIESGAQWMRENFNTREDQTRVYSLVKHPDATYNLAVKSPGRTKSMAGDLDLTEHVPPHILTLFDEVVQAEPAQPGGADFSP